ncbi:DUF3027 domain-containing protein [Cryobacterium sp. TMS1-13-1]|uniref:DUF3027 domain-containing protein n=1 Tax=Cryobacterium sp. TMS1-13-1 TaxID=1259220 RepID=UPI001069009A|nr:DUF3027 domain-containing protein [Cryobacterium sp. TMS1-13-1]TFD19583.1 DUF3027 domain-containing protein [Cryobacterium sp. TMS1-13-1]
MPDVPDVQPTDAQPTTAKPTDATLLAAVDLARAALLEITDEDTIGEVIGHLDEGELVISLLFDCLMTGYPGWRWTVSLARVDENAAPTVLETELTPGDDSLLAPEWVPWSDRLVEDDSEADVDDSDSENYDDSDDDDESDEDSDDESDEDSDDESDDDDDDDESDDESDDDDDSLDALDGIDFDEALAAAELNPGETGESEPDADHSAPQPPTRSRRARRP